MGASGGVLVSKRKCWSEPRGIRQVITGESLPLLTSPVFLQGKHLAYLL